jgi:hypothetical protein
VQDYIETQICYTSVVNTDYLKHLKSQFKNSYIKSPFVKMILRWVFDHYKLYKEAPGDAIFTYYENWARSRPENDDRVGILEVMMSNLEDDLEIFKNINIGFIIKETDKYFAERELDILIEDVQLHKDKGELFEAQSRVSEYKQKDINIVEELDLFNDQQLIYDAFEEDYVPLFKFPGALGNMMNMHFIRGGFVGIMGPEKSGKTWHLMNMALTAFRQGNNVAYFEAGDSTPKQFMRRLGVYLTKGNYVKQFTGKQKVPVLDCVRNQLNICRLKERVNRVSIVDDPDTGTLLSYEDAVNKRYQPCSVCSRHNKKEYEGTYWWSEINVPAIDWQDVYEKTQRWNKMTKGKKFKSFFYPSDTLTMDTVQDTLEMLLEKENFVADVVIVDYMDIMDESIPPGGSEREATNKKWKKARQISQKRDLLFIAGTQADAQSYGKYILDKSNFSEDKRKFSHVTAMFGINQTDEEKEVGVMRWNTLVQREGMFVTRRTVTVLQSLVTGRAHTASF